MASQITTTLTTPPTAPNRSQDPDTFNTNIDNRLAWDSTNVSEITTWQSEANTVSTEINANATAAETSANNASTSETNAGNSESAAAASANFKGLWSSLSGALNIPASVEHNSVFWILNTNSADVTTDEPGVSTKWSLLRPTNINLAREIGGTAYQNITGFALTPSFDVKSYDYVNEPNGYHPLATVSRASTATYSDHLGVMRSAAVDVLRHWWDPATGEYRGILVEGASTNLITHSEELDNAAWGKSGATVTANNSAAPDGTTTMDKLVEDTSTGAHAATDNVAISAGTHVASVFASAEEYSHFVFVIGHTGESSAVSFIDFSLTSGPQTTTNGLITDAGFEDWGSGIKRCWVKYTLTGAAASHAAQLKLTQTLGGSDSYTGDGTSGLNFWGMHVEKQSEMTSYIPTSGATATRASDSVKFEGVNFSDWFNATQGTIAVMCAKMVQPSSASRIIDIGGGVSDTDRMGFFYRSTGQTAAQVIDASVTQFDSTPTGVLTANQKINLTMSYKVNDFASSGDGGGLTTDASGTLPTVDTMSIGSSRAGAAHINGFVSQVTYFPRQLTDAQLQVLSS